MIGLEKDLQKLTETLQRVGNALPKHIDKIKEKIGKEESKVIDDAMKHIDYEETMKEFNQMPQKMAEFMKKHGY